LWVLEDLQWADAETLSLLPLLLPYLAESRALLLLTGRSTELRSNPAAWDALQALDRAGYFPRYTLTRLGADAVGCLVRDLLNEDDLALTEHLARESEGVPLYLVETLKAWRDEGYLLSDEYETWRWRGDAPAALPSHLGEAVIAHRLSRLSPTAGELLAAAAVIGAEVDFDLLTDVCASPASDLTTTDLYLLASDELLRRGFLVEAEAGYRFSHERVRQTVYRRLPRRERARLHRKVARALEELFPERFELLAHHFVAAGERQPAIHYLTRAADCARGIFAHQTALTCYERLLKILTYPEDRPARYDVLRDRAEVLGWIGDREAQGGDLEELLRLARALSDDARIASTLHQRSEWRWLQGRYQSAEEDALAALEIYRRLGDDHGQAVMLTQLGRSILYTDDCLQAVTYFQQALPTLEAANDFKGQIECLMGLAYVAQYRGDLSLSLDYCQRSLVLAKAAHNHRLINYTLSSVGLGYVDLGDMNAAEPYLRQALHLAEISGERRRRGITLVRLAHIALNRGDFEMAQTHLQTALETLREVQDVSWEAYALSLLGELELLQDDPVAAREHQEAAYQLRSELGEHADAALGLSYLALSELALGDETAAWQHSREVIAKAEAEWSVAERPPEVYYNHFRVAEATRHWAAARAALEEAARIVDERAERIGDPAWQRKYRTGLMVNRAIAEAVAGQPPPGRLRVRLARAGTPAHRRPTPGEIVTVTWMIDAGEEDVALAGREGKVALRRHRLLRLLAEAEAAGARPTVADLAGGLDVSPRTVRADLAALRRQGHVARTRGHRA
ncbi:MAG: tetratricopeptide repeat protein, partial [Chloroflexota bacterium]|nr:tetratricopeptide repeat protein [Chloroflexota bacterium]